MTGTGGVAVQADTTGLTKTVEQVGTVSMIDEGKTGWKLYQISMDIKTRLCAEPGSGSGTS